MALQLEGASTAGDGGVKRVLVTDGGRLSTLSASQDSTLVAALEGNSFNLNTGVIASLSTADSALFYYKHLEDIPLVIDSIIVGFNDGDANDQQTVKIIKNPTAGTIVSGASTGDIIENRDFNSADSLSSSTFYKGANGNTFTDGDDYIITYASENARNVLPISTVLRKGNSIGITASPALATGTISAYVAAVCHLAAL